MRVLVCGGRGYSDREYMDRYLRLIDRAKGPFDWVLCLQPTSPLRHSGDILEAIDMARGGASAVVSVTPVLSLSDAWRRCFSHEWGDLSVAA